MPLGFFTRNKSSGAASAAAIRGADYSPADKPSLPEDPLAQALQAGRLGWIAAQPARWRDRPDYAAVRDRVLQALDDRFALVPEGLVSIPTTIFDEPGGPEINVETQPYLLARCAVTNAEYQHFVDAGGYEDLALWPEDIWPHLINLKDQTGCPGPRFWQQGRHDKRLARHPVVGVCYYEALAYVQWAGYRLPTEAEWQMAATWRIRSAATAPRRYPWGDGLDLSCCNIWAAGHGGTLPVDACPGGAAPNGVLQLIGNVWEWTSSDFESTDREGRKVVGDTLMKSIRGGAFDTYFPWQATGDFRTAAPCLARYHNIGFRCAMDLLND